jgi:hypothetical protein
MDVGWLPFPGVVALRGRLELGNADDWVDPSGVTMIEETLMTTYCLARLMQAITTLAVIAIIGLGKTANDTETLRGRVAFRPGAD